MVASHRASRQARSIPPYSPPKHEHELAQARAYLEGQGIKAAYQPVIGEVLTAILDAAHELDADLIVVGSRDHNVLQRLLDESISECRHRTRR